MPESVMFLHNAPQGGWVNAYLAPPISVVMTECHSNSLTNITWYENDLLSSDADQGGSVDADRAPTISPRSLRSNAHREDLDTSKERQLCEFSRKK